MRTQSPTLQAELEAYDAEHSFARQVLPPEEDRMRLPVLGPWRGGYRWFRSPNVICLEKVRRLRAEGRL